jgi:tetratricopeptide (TPR) repeat protein
MRGSRRARATVAVAALLTGCSGLGSRIDRLPENANRQGYVTVSKPVTVPRSSVESDCGPESVCAVMHYWGKPASVAEISLLIRDPKRPGIYSPDLAALARNKGLRARFLSGTVGRIKTAIDRDVPPIIMVEVAASAFHYFVVSGYNDRTAILVCEDYDGSKRLISYEDVEAAWQRPDHVMLELDPSTADADYRAAANLESEGLFGEAVVLHKRALQNDPAHYEARVGLANCYLAQGKLPEALEEYRQAYQANAIDPKVCNNLANIYLELKRDLAEAERLSSSAVDQYQAAYLRIRGDVEREPQAAVRAVRERELARAERDLAHSLGTLGQARAAAGKHLLAISAWQASYDHFSLTEFDWRAKRLYEIGLSRRALSMPAEAKKSLEQALGEAKDPFLQEKIRAALKP